MVVLYSIYAILMIIVSVYRRALSNKEFFVDAHGRQYRTGGRVVALTLVLSLGLYAILLVLLLRIP
jgi:hypothetical protein